MNIFKKIKQFLTDRGYYNIPKWLRHTGGSLILAWIAMGIISIFTGNYNFVAGALISWLIGFFKETKEHGFSTQTGYDMMLNMWGVLLSLSPWFIEVF